MRAAIYARVSTLDQEPENQLQDLRRYIESRGWYPVEYVDKGVSGAKDRRPALDTLLRDATRRRFDVLVCWRLDRLGRNLKHLVTLPEELQSPASKRRTECQRADIERLRQCCGDLTTKLLRDNDESADDSPTPAHVPRNAPRGPLRAAALTGC